MLVRHAYYKSKINKVAAHLSSQNIPKESKKYNVKHETLPLKQKLSHVHTLTA